MPGQAKIVSVTIAKATKMPNYSQSTVTSGIRMFLSRCTPTTRERGRPLARAIGCRRAGRASRAPARVRRITREGFERRGVQGGQDAHGAGRRASKRSRSSLDRWPDAARRRRQQADVAANAMISISPTQNVRG